MEQLMRKRRIKQLRIVNKDIHPYCTTTLNFTPEDSLE